MATYRGRCARHARTQDMSRDNYEARHWYYTKAWRVLRALTLAKDPVCRACRLAPSIDVDHIVPHRGDRARFFDGTNLQGLCVECHSKKTQRGE
jgi:5-methylcytosine-specific restriction protein A